MCRLVPTGRLYTKLRFMPLGSYRTSPCHTVLLPIGSNRTSLQNIALCVSWFSQDVCIQHCAVSHLVPTAPLYTTLRCMPLGSHRTSLFNTVLLPVESQWMSLGNSATWFPKDVSRKYCFLCHLVLAGHLHTTVRYVQIGFHGTCL